MAAITEKRQVAQLKALTKEPGWDILLIVLEELVTKTESEEISGSNEFETLRMLHTNKGMVKGMKLLVEEAERRANE